MNARSHLYVPGDAGDRLERAPARGADAVLADLADTLAPARKSAAVKAVAGHPRVGVPQSGEPDEAVVRASRRTVALTRVPQDSEEVPT